MFSGEREQVVPYGINVTTYAMMQTRAKANRVPEAIRSSGLVFMDEGHHSMTLQRMDFLRNVFDQDAVRIALTATPDFNLRRTLCTHFPYLIHEISLLEAVELDLLAPLRAWVIEIDADGSVVQVRNGQYDDEVLGRLMSAAPFFEAVRTVRYAPEYRNVQTLITCASCQQAYDLTKYLTTHKPPHVPTPKLILGTTKQREREWVIEHFKVGGNVDTIVSVRTLLEGFDAPRCKLLLDLSPSASRVTATQKFCRVLTRFGDEEARIYCFVPKKLSLPPILPMELLLPSVDGYDAGELIASKRSAAGTQKRLRHPRIHPIEGVEVKSRIVLSVTVEKPKLDPANRFEVRQVLASNSGVLLSVCPSFFAFRALLFRHELFMGRGDHLLRYCGFPARREGYERFLAIYCPDAAANRILEDKSGKMRSWILEAARWFESSYGRPPGSRAELLTCLAGYLAAAPEVDEETDDLLEIRDEWMTVRALLDEMRSSHAFDVRALELYYGLTGEENVQLQQIGEPVGLSREAVRQRINKRISAIRKQLLQLDSLYTTPSGIPVERFEEIPVGLSEEERYRHRISRKRNLLFDPLHPDAESCGRSPSEYKRFRRQIEVGWELHLHLVRNGPHAKPDERARVGETAGETPPRRESDESGKDYLQWQIDCFGRERYDKLIYEIHRIKYGKWYADVKFGRTSG
jgi:hypothetical protein